MAIDAMNMGPWLRPRNARSRFSNANVCDIDDHIAGMYSPNVLLTSAVLLVFLTGDDDGYRYCVFTWSLRTLQTLIFGHRA